MPKGKSYGRKAGKVMNFSQAVIGTSSKRTKKKSIGRIVTSSNGKVDMSPSRKMAPKRAGKRVY